MALRGTTEMLLRLAVPKGHLRGRVCTLLLSPRSSILDRLGRTYAQSTLPATCRPWLPEAAAGFLLGDQPADHCPPHARRPARSAKFVSLQGALIATSMLTNRSRYRAITVPDAGTHRSAAARCRSTP